ncbi:hypothetical protein ZWY2020_053637, partial [Hordeum vulgare]
PRPAAAHFQKATRRGQGVLLIPNPALPNPRTRASSVPAVLSDGGSSSSRRGAQVARRRALAPGRRRRRQFAPLRAEAQLRPRLRQGPRPAAAHFQKATRRGQGVLLVPVGVSAIFFADRAAANGVADRAVPLPDSGHAPAPAPRRRRAAARAAPDRPRFRRKEGRAGTAGCRRHRAVQ